MPHPPLDVLAAAALGVKPQNPQVAVRDRRLAVGGCPGDDGQVRRHDQRLPIERRLTGLVLPCELARSSVKAPWAAAAAPPTESVAVWAAPAGRTAVAECIFAV